MKTETIWDMGIIRYGYKYITLQQISENQNTGKAWSWIVQTFSSFNNMKIYQVHCNIQGTSHKLMQPELLEQDMV